MALYYSECPEEALQDFQISKLMTGKRLQPTDFARIGLFLGIEVKELLRSAREDFCIAKFDENCLQFLRNGIGVNETARRLGVTSSTVRNIRDGKLTADKKTRICQSGGKKKDWEAFDKQLLPQVKKTVSFMKEKAGERPVKITKYYVAEQLEIPPKSFVLLIWKVFDVNFSLSLGEMGRIFLYILVVANLYGILVTLISKSELMAGILGSSVAALLSILGGTFVPVCSMPRILQAVSILSPMRWLM